MPAADVAFYVLQLRRLHLLPVRSGQSYKAQQSSAGPKIPFPNEHHNDPSHTAFLS